MVQLLCLTCAGSWTINGSSPDDTNLSLWVSLWEQALICSQGRENYSLSTEALTDHSAPRLDSFKWTNTWARKLSICADTRSISSSACNRSNNSFTNSQTRLRN